MKRTTLESILRFIVHNFTRTDYVGLENLPKQGPVIVATNHLSQIDTILLMLNPPRPDITALVTDKYKRFAFIRWFINTANGIWIDRDRADFGAFRAAIEALKKGAALGIAPEGTRSLDYKLQEGKAGTVLLALKTNAPIVPVAINGTESGFQKLARFQRPHFYVRYGKPFTLPPVERENREGSMQRMTDEIMARIAVMLPPEYRGFYARHPRVLELLQQPGAVQQVDASHRIL